MYCTKCGQQIQDGSRFCPYCGATQGGKVEYTGQGQGQQIHKNTAILAGMSATDIVVAVLYIFLLLRWSDIFLSNIKPAYESFTYWGEDVKFLGTLVFCLPYILIVALGIIGINELRLHRYHISIGIFTIIISVIMKIGKVLFDEVTFKAVSSVCHRIFSVYGNIWITTVVLGLLISGMLYAKMAQR